MITSKWFRFIIAKIYNILRYVIARTLRHMCNLHIKETEISQRRSKRIKNWKIAYSVILSVLSNKTNLILGFSSPLNEWKMVSICFLFPFEGSRLETVVYKKMSTQSLEECKDVCFEDGCCRSVNYQTKSSHQNCELTHGKENEDHGDLVQTVEYEFRGLVYPNRVSTIYTITWLLCTFSLVVARDLLEDRWTDYVTNVVWFM